MERVTLLCAAAVLLSCGRGFQKAAPVANVCALLSIAEAATLAPGLTTATEQPHKDSPDVWTRSCKYTGRGVVAHADLVVSGALTSGGAQQLADELGFSAPEMQVIVVAGLGDHAVYRSYKFESEWLGALRGRYAVGVGKTYGGIVGEGAFEPLVRSVLAQLPD